MTRDTTSQQFFDDKYRQCDDPWNFGNSAYESKRYARILRALGGRNYRRAFEPGCSIGILTSQLATVCARVEAMDISEIAVGKARQHWRSLRNIEFICGRLPHDFPDGPFDLIVFSELGYYFSEDALASLGNALVQRLDRDGVLLAVHWLGVSADHILAGDQVHDILRELSGITLDHSVRHEAFRLDRWSRN